MGLEIERKFLLCNEDWRAQVETSTAIRQAYLGGDGVSVRIRIADKQSWLNVKAMQMGISRQDFEYPVPLEDAEAMYALARGGEIRKIRHYVAYKDHTWEIDEFQGDHQGLIVAEIELQQVDQWFEKPPWLGQEVTDDERYYNVFLANNAI